MIRTILHYPDKRLRERGSLRNGLEALPMRLSEGARIKGGGRRWAEVLDDLSGRANGGRRLRRSRDSKIGGHRPWRSCDLLLWQNRWRSGVRRNILCLCWNLR